MSITLTVTDIDPGTGLLWAVGTVAFSGNYSTGGDTLDWTQIAQQISVQGFTIASAEPGAGPVQVFFDSQNGNAGYYVPVKGAAPNTWKLKAFLGGGTEVGAGAYPSSVTSDVVSFQVAFRKLQ